MHDDFYPRLVSGGQADGRENGKIAESSIVSVITAHLRGLVQQTLYYMDLKTCLNVDTVTFTGRCLSRSCNVFRTEELALFAWRGNTFLHLVTKQPFAMLLL